MRLQIVEIAATIRQVPMMRRVSWVIGRRRGPHVQRDAGHDDADEDAGADALERESSRRTRPTSPHQLWAWRTWL